MWARAATPRRPAGPEGPFRQRVTEMGDPMDPAAARTDRAASPFLSALRGARPARAPIWIMRQAGRYLPEYQAVRSRASFLRMCRTPELACEVTLQPVRRFGLDAAVLFSDILLPLEPMGAPFAFTEQGPRLERPLREERDVAGLRAVPAAEHLGFVGDAIRLIKRERPDVPLIGFAGAPLTLAAYLVEGGSSLHFRHLKQLLYARPDVAGVLLDRLAEQVADHLRFQVACGCDAVQLFDTWGGILAPADYEELVLPRVRRVFAALDDAGVPRILFLKGAAPLLPLVPRTGADAVGLDWTVDLATAARALPGLPLQGNLDPAVLFADPGTIRRRAAAVLAAGREAPAHVFNLGHGILPETPVAAVEALVETVHASGKGTA